jgi:MoxR-like ATPase
MQPKTPGNFGELVDSFRADCDVIVAEVDRVIVGHDEALRDVLTCLLAGGHALLEGIPGLGKTLLVRTLADVLGLSFSRIQFTPDLMPSDIMGTQVIGPGGGGLEFRPGPIFGNLILADEINRATPKTQSALLEAMSEGTVSVGGTTRRLDSPFCVLATQNPLDLKGTYPLPEAQLDRFMLKILLHSPGVEQLMTILDRTTGIAAGGVHKSANGGRIAQMRELVSRIPAASPVVQYVSHLVLATQPTSQHAPPIVREYVRHGSSPRGAQAIIRTAKVLALRRGRVNVAFSDVRSVAAAALRHRIVLSFGAAGRGISSDEIVDQIIQSVRPEDVG